MSAPTPSRAGWLRGPAWDTACLSFCWVPLYLWFVFGLRLGDGGGEVVLFAQRVDALALAVIVVLALTYVHRHYTFVLVYGDPRAFSERARAYVVAPVVVLGIVLGARLWGNDPLARAGGVRVSAWDLLLVTSGVWNVWHTVQQRYGILRIYAGKAGGGLEARTEATRDRVLVWTLVVLLAVVLLTLRASTFESHPSGLDVLRALGPVIESPLFGVFAVCVGIAASLVVFRWARAERRASLSMPERVPRLAFLASTLALLAVFVVHGPVVGYLTFGSAHALEYLAFVHHFAERKFTPGGSRPSLASWLFTRPLAAAPLLIGVLGLAYLSLQGVASTDAYVTYYVGTSMLHFLYDGWIWKVRRPDVATPLGARPSLA